MIPTLVGVSLVIFVIMHLMPGDVVLQMLAESSSFDPKDEARLRHQLGIDRPLTVQYLDWLWGLARLDLGTSLWTGQPVAQEIWRRLPVTLELGLLSLGMGTLIGVLFGVLSALKQDSWVDYGTRLVSILWLSVPNFVVGTLLVVLPAVYFGYFGPMRFTPIHQNPLANLSQLIFPAVALSLRMSASTMRMSRSTMLEVFKQDYIRTARAKGLREHLVVRRHAIKNGMIPVVTIIGDQASTVVGGSVVMEAIFGLPGVGRLVLESIAQRDLTMVQGVVMFFAAVVVVMNLLVDISYGWFDPRIRYGRA